MEQTSAQPTEIGTFLFSYDCEKESVRCLFCANAGRSGA